VIFDQAIYDDILARILLYAFRLSPLSTEFLLFLGIIPLTRFLLVVTVIFLLFGILSVSLLLVP